MIRYVKEKYETPFYGLTGDKPVSYLLWGDRVRVIDDSGDMWKVHARGRDGRVKRTALGTKSLLEFYFVDVGQGDGVLIRTPDGRHILIDGGWPRAKQPTGKNVGDFVDWKFKKDYERDTINLDAVICSHNDQDHYGGLWDLFDTGPTARAELECSDVTAEAIYHAGLGWWVGPDDRTLGPYTWTQNGAMFTQLLGNRASVEAGLKSNADPKIQGEWKRFWTQAVKTKTRGGEQTPIQRLSHANWTLPEFNDPDGVSIRVLGPVEFTVDGEPAIRRLDSAPGQNTNGNSVLLRVDYDKTRVLLTGDLNQNSQEALLRDYAGETDEFEVDISKGCHHGSGDVSNSFLKTIAPSATIIQSGDCESHDHPTPEVIAASGFTGREYITPDDVFKRPLVYITELARSIAMGTPTAIEVPLSDGNTLKLSGDDLKKVKVTYKVAKAGKRARTKTVPLHRPNKTLPRQIVDFTTFGLVNVRTDGKRLLIAARNEADQSWNYDVIDGRF